MSQIANLSDLSNPLVSIRQRAGRVELTANVVLSGGLPDLVGNITTELNKTFVTVSLTNSGGTSTIVPTMPLGDFLFASLCNDGCVAMTAPATSTGLVRGMVDLTNRGALPLGDRDRLDFVFSGAFFGVAGSYLKINTLDFPEDATTLNWIDKTVVPAAQQYEISTVNASFLLVDKTKVNYVELAFADNGRRVTYTSSEAEALSRDILLFRGSNNGKPVTAMDLNLLYIPVENVARVKVETNTANTNVYTYVPKTF